MRSIDPSERLAANVSRPGLSTALASLLPTGVFLGVDWQAGVVPAMVAASVAPLARTVMAWPVMAVLIFFLIAYVRFRLDRHEWALASSSPA